MLKNSSLFHFRNDRILIWSLRVSACIVALIAIFIFLFLVTESFPLLQEVGILRFFRDSAWHPREGEYGLLPMLSGSLFAMAGSVLIATPVGILAAIFTHFYAPRWLAKVLRLLIEILAGIPSVVYGFWGLVVLVPMIAENNPPGASLLAAILILTIMILPTVALMADASLESVSENYLVGAASLGFSRWGVVSKIALPSAKSGLLTGLILQSGRAIGETMAVLMVAGNVVQNPQSIFDPIRTLTANIALEMAYATGSHRSALFVCGLILLVLITVLVIAADILQHRLQEVRT